MPPNRRDFLKGLAATAASIPVLGVTQRTTQSGTSDDPEGPALDSPSGLQQHGDQPEFYIHSWNLEHFVDQVIVGSQRIVGLGEDTIHLEVYTKYPAELQGWCMNKPLTVDLPQIDKTLQVKVTAVESMLLNGASDVIMMIDGIMKA